jgi:hypothetical protein
LEELFQRGSPPPPLAGPRLGMDGEARREGSLLDKRPVVARPWSFRFVSPHLILSESLGVRSFFDTSSFVSTFHSLRAGPRFNTYLTITSYDRPADPAKNTPQTKTNLIPSVLPSI